MLLIVGIVEGKGGIIGLLKYVGFFSAFTATTWSLLKSSQSKSQLLLPTHGLLHFFLHLTRSL